jgi:predicted peptidase
MPYRVYVPKSYVPSKPMPLIVALHGLGGSEDDFFIGYGKQLPALAEAHGYIVVAPLGYRADGFYGSSVGVGARDAAAARRAALSEADVLGVLAEARKHYNIDPARIYLVGHSMGAIGTWSLLPKYPGIWAAAGVFSGLGDTTTAVLMKDIPQFVVHGDADATVNVSGSRMMVAALRSAHADVTYTEVPGGSHVSVVEPNLAAMFTFFDSRKKASR